MPELKPEYRSLTYIMNNIGVFINMDEARTRVFVALKTLNMMNLGVYNNITKLYSPVNYSYDYLNALIKAHEDGNIAHMIIKPFEDSAGY